MVSKRYYKSVMSDFKDTVKDGYYNYDLIDGHVSRYNMADIDELEEILNTLSVGNYIEQLYEYNEQVMSENEHQIITDAKYDYFDDEELDELNEKGYNIEADLSDILAEYQQINPGLDKLFDYNILLIDTTNEFEIYTDGLTLTTKTVVKNNDYKKFKRLAQKYISPSEFTTLINNAGTSYADGKLGVIINGGEIIEAIQDGSLTVNGTAVVILENQFEGSGYAIISNKDAKVSLKHAEINYGEYSISSLMRIV